MKRIDVKFVRRRLLDSGEAVRGRPSGMRMKVPKENVHAIDGPDEDAKNMDDSLYPPQTPFLHPKREEPKEEA